MNEYDARTYGDLIAEKYDQLYPKVDEQMIQVLCQRAESGETLELGIGTGRVAIPLARAGVSVSGIDASESMTEKLKRKAGGEAIEVHIGSFSEFQIERKFALIYVVFNTFFALLSQEEQVGCMRTVARHLAPEGTFVIEAFVPDLCRYEGGQGLRVVSLDKGIVRLDASQLERAEQVVTSQHVFLSADGIELYPVKLRFAYPSELDLMAQLAGMELTDRWAGWDGRAYDGESKSHISMYSLAS